MLLIFMVYAIQVNAQNKWNKGPFSGTKKDSLFYTYSYCKAYQPEAVGKLDSFKTMISKNIFIKNNTLCYKNPSELYFIKYITGLSGQNEESVNISLLHVSDYDVIFNGINVFYCNAGIKDDIRSVPDTCVLDWLVYDKKLKKVICGDFGKSLMKDEQLNYYISK